MDLLRFCHPEILQFLKDNFSLNIAPKELKVVFFTKFHKLLKYL